MGSYKNISEKNSTLDASESLITEKDTNLLGRKLFKTYMKIMIIQKMNGIYP